MLERRDYMFDAKEVKTGAVKWIRDWFAENGPDSPAIIGISGGKDSTVAAALCVEALGKDRVVGVMMPNGHQADLADARRVCELLEIENHTCNIANIVGEFKQFRPTSKTSKQAMENLPPRVRMTLLYYISQNLNGRVCNTCNLSEDYLGYSTRWGDECGDFAPLKNLTCTEVVKLGDALGLPKELVHKVPSDGLCGQTDEDRFGFTYRELDKMLRHSHFDLAYPKSLSKEVKQAIKKRHDSTEFKRRPIASFTPKLDRPYRLGLVVGRFQPLHYGHMDVIREAFALCDKVLIMVGSAQESKTYNNPFTFEERQNMIRAALDLDFEPTEGRFQIVPLPDAGLGNNSRWGDYVLTEAKKASKELPDVFITGEESRRDTWFRREDIDTIVIKKTEKLKGKELSASTVREMLYAGETDELLNKGVLPHYDWYYIMASGIVGHPPKDQETQSI